MPKTPKSHKPPRPTSMETKEEEVNGKKKCDYEPLSVPEAPPPSETEEDKKPIKIKIEAMENIKDLSVKILIQHGEKTLGETEIIPLSNDDETIINFEAVLMCNPTKQQSLDDIVANPVLFTITDCTGKSAIADPASDTGKSPKQKIEPKKSTHKEESFTVLGQCNLDLLPLLLGELSTKQVLLIQLLNKSMGPERPAWPNLPRLSVLASTEEPLITDKEEYGSNILFFTVGSMYNVPPSFTDRMQFSAATVIPLRTGDFESVYFHNGSMKVKKETDKSIRWAGLHHLTGRSGYSLYKMNEDEIRTNLKVDLKSKLEEDIPRIEWNMLRRCWITKETGDLLYSIISKYHCWALEIIATEQQSLPLSSKTKSRDTTSNQRHFIAYPDISTLLFPGVTKVRAAAQVYTYSQGDVASKFVLQHSLFENMIPEVDKNESRGGTAKSKKSDQKSSKKSDKKSSSKALSKKSEQQSSVLNGSQSAAPPVEQSFPLYREGEDPVFVIIEVEILKPLLMKRTAFELNHLIREAIPSRPEFPKLIMGADLAEKHYRQCIETMSETIIKEYTKFIRANVNTSNVSVAGSEKERICFFYHLSNGGIYQLLKALLKNKISLLLEHKCEVGKTCKPHKDAKIQKHISDAYVYLVEEMHSVLNSLLEDSFPYFDENDPVPSSQLFFFAMEADEEELFETVNHLMLRRISHDEMNPDIWFEYGVFFVKHGQTEKAKECIKEALSLDIRHKFGLLLYAILLARNGEYEIAEIFFEALTVFYPRFAEAWVILHLFYLKIGHFIGAEVALTMSKKCYKNKKDLESVITTESLLWCTTKYSNDSLFLITAITLLKLHIYEYVEMALAQELIYNGSSIPYLYYLSVTHYLEGCYEEAIVHVTEAVKEHGKDYCLWSLLGHCHHKLGNVQEARDYYQHVVDMYDRPNNIHLVVLRLGNYYLKEENYEMAKNILLNACKHSPSPMTWFGVGVACYMMGNFTEAEDALSEANMLDNENPSIWGYLTLINLQNERHFEFEQCYRQAIRHGLDDPYILERIKAYQKKLNYPDAVDLYLK